MTFTPRGTAPREINPTLLRLFSRLRAYRVKGWDHDSEGPTWPAIDREAGGLIDADVISSELIFPPALAPAGDKRHHVVALDIDYPAHLVESSTPGHFHLYLEVPGGVPHATYMQLLKDLARAKVIQDGYASMSRERGHSDLRLPWVAKEPYPSDLGLPVVLGVIPQPAPRPHPFDFG